MPQSYNNFLNQIVYVDLWTDNIDLARLSNSSPLAAAGSPINDTSHFSLSCRNQSYLDICSLDTLFLVIICSVLKEIQEVRIVLTRS